MKKIFLSLSILLLTLFFSISCKTAPVIQPEEPQEIIEQPKVQEPIIEEEVTPEVIEKVESEDFEVSEEEYNQTFFEIEKLILILNELVSKKKYSQWKAYLSQNYIKEISSPENLNSLSQTPILKENGIILSTLKDYFDWVVVPSRTSVTLDEIEFIDETHVIAYMYYEGQKTILYYLEIIENEWKITVR